MGECVHEGGSMMPRVVSVTWEVVRWRLGYLSVLLLHSKMAGCRRCWSMLSLNTNYCKGGQELLPTATLCYAALYCLVV
jgi:hypothetical protein